MNEIELYEALKERLEISAKYMNISDVELNKYFSLTDYQSKTICSFEKNSIEQVYAQFALHAQNATMIKNIIKFKDNFEFLKSVFSGFEPNSFLKKYYDEKEREDVVDELVELLRYSNNNPKGLVWKTDKSKKPDQLVRRFVEAMIDGALFFRNKTKEQLLLDFKCYYDKGYKALIKYFMNNINHGFSVALTCDFLKELDSYFDIPKPDVHIKDVLAKYYNKKYKEKNWEYECIDDFINIVNVLKKHNININCYKLDKMIWLCCTSSFYLHESKNSKDILLDIIN